MPFPLKPGIIKQAAEKHAFRACLLSLILIGAPVGARDNATQFNTSPALASLEITLSQVPQYLWLDARVEAAQAATVAAQTSGRILKLYYDVNDLVPQGAPLLEITSKAQGAEYSAAEAELAKAIAINQEAQAQYRRVIALFPQGAISKGGMDEAKAKASTTEQAVSGANANLIKAKETLNYTVVSAPFSGRVTQRHVEQGETVSLGQALFSGYSTDTLRLIAHIPQQFYPQAAKAPKESFSMLFQGKAIKLEQVTLMAFADPLTHSHQVRLNLTELSPQPVPGQWLKIRLSLGKQDGIRIPASALLQLGELACVYRIKEGKLIQTQVRLGQRTEHGLVVSAGLLVGDVIALDASQALAKAAQRQDSQTHKQAGNE